MGVTGRFKSAADSLTMKHVSQYELLDRDLHGGLLRSPEQAIRLPVDAPLRPYHAFRPAILTFAGIIRHR
jgi:hypothetical protein